MEPECECYICRDHLDFELDEFLLDEIERGNAVIFAGSGVSTENRLSSPNTLYEEVAHQLGLITEELSFADLMQKFADKRDGQFQLFGLIQKRFDQINMFSDLKYSSRKFFRELATMTYIDTYITTNWDRNFEEECNAKTFTYDQDVRFWDIPDRKVLKIHGTIDDYSSMVVTREDYENSLRTLEKSLIGSKLKDLLTTKTCIFSGYSMKDDDFHEIFSFVRRSQGRFIKDHFFVSPYANAVELPENVIPIKTDGTHFLSVIKEHFSNKNCYISDDIFEHVNEELDYVESKHIELWEKFSAADFPQIIMSASYQDGLIHGYQNALNYKFSGKYSDCHYLKAKSRGYDELISKHRKRKSYFDTSYFTGYQNSIIAILMFKKYGEFCPAPVFYFEGVGEMEESEFIEKLTELPSYHKSAYRECERIVKEKRLNNGHVVQHMPWG